MERFERKMQAEERGEFERGVNIGKLEKVLGTHNCEIHYVIEQSQKFVSTVTMIATKLIQ